MGNEAQKQTQWEPVWNENEVQHSTKHKRQQEQVLEHRWKQNA